MNVYDMSRKDFERLPWRDNWNSEGSCQQIVILPQIVRRWRWWYHRVRCLLARLLRLEQPEEWQSIPNLHDSGFGCIDYIAVVDNEPVCRLAGCSDVLHIEGIGGYGYGYRWLERIGAVPRMIAPAGWQFDLLPKSGLLRLWPSNRKHIIYSGSYSSFEIYSSDSLPASDQGLNWQDHLEQAKVLLGVEDDMQGV